MKTKILTLSALLLVVTLFSCSKEDDHNIEIREQSPIVLKAKQGINLNAYSTKPITYKSENEFHAKVSNIGVVTAQYVGETKINLTNGSDSKSVQVVVKPNYNLYETPKVKWGTARSEIKTQYGNPNSEMSDAIGYTNYSSPAPIIMFLFDSNDRLTSYSVLVKMTYATTLGEFLVERYLPIKVDSDKYTAMFVNGLTTDKVTTGIRLSVYNTTYLMVLYVDARDLNRNSVGSASEITIDNYQDILEKTIK